MVTFIKNIWVVVVINIRPMRMVRGLTSEEGLVATTFLRVLVDLVSISFSLFFVLEKAKYFRGLFCLCHWQCFISFESNLSRHLCVLPAGILQWALPCTHGLLAIVWNLGCLLFFGKDTTCYPLLSSFDVSIFGGDCSVIVVVLKAVCGHSFLMCPRRP